jgi:hypothetical protein
MKSAKRHIGKSPFLILSLLLVIKIVLLRVFLFEEISLKGLFFDLAFILVLASLIELLVPKKLIKGFYWLINIILSIIFFAASVYLERVSHNIHLSFSVEPSRTSIGQHQIHDKAKGLPLLR